MGRNENGQGTFVKLENGKWQCRMMCQYQTENGKKKMVSGTGKIKEEARKNALKKRKEWDKVRESGSTVNTKLKEKIFSELMREWIEIYSAERQWSGNTKITRSANLENMIISKIGNLKIKSITTSILNLLFIQLLDEYSRQNVGMVYSLTGNFFEYLKIQHIISENPFLDVMKLPSKKKSAEFTQDNLDLIEFEDELKIFTEQEIQKLFDICYLYENINNFKPKYPRAPIFAVMFLTGMRAQEIRALRLADINFGKHEITISKALSVSKNNNEKIEMVIKETKTKNSKRIIGINLETEKYLKLLIKNRPNKECEWLCCTKNGTWIDRRNFLRTFHSILKGASIETNERGPHSLRHTFISFSIEKNKLSPLYNREMLFISKYVGHADLTTTLNIYTLQLPPRPLIHEGN